MRFVEGGLLSEELNTVSFSPKSVCKLSILRPFVVYFRRVIKFVVLPLWPSPSFLLLKSKRTKFILVATTAKKAMFITERCLSVGDTGSFRRGGGYSLIFALRLCAAPKGMVFFNRFGLNSGMVFEGIQLRWTYLSFQFQMNKKESICEFEMDFKKSFCSRSNLGNNLIISAYTLGLKTGLDFRGHGCGKWQFICLK